MRTVEDRAHSLGQLLSREQPVGLYDLTLAMNPLGLYRVEPRALGGQKAVYDPHSRAAAFDCPVVGGDPLSDLSLEMCQEALSQINTQTFLPAV